MRIEELFISEEKSGLEALRLLDEKGCRILFVAPGGVLKAVITDADVRKFILRGGNLEQPVGKAANYNPKSLPVERRSEARELMLRYNIDALPLLDKAGHIQEIVFDSDLDIDTRKSACLPVVIMAGGLGTRLYPYTKILPKPLIPVGEMPIIEHIIHRFQKFGCNDFSLIVNYKKNMIKSYFNDLEKDYAVSYVDEEKPLGTGGGLSLMKGQISTPFFLTNCDILVDADYGDIYDKHKEAGNVITMVCALKHFTIPYGVIELGENGDITNIKEKPEMNFLTNAGVYLCEPQVISDLAENQAVSMVEIVEKYRAAGKRIGVYPVSESSWMDMGQIEELDNMRRRIEKGGAV